MKLLNPKGNVNLHTHTFYCDGKNSPAELAEQAEKLGFCALGFSGHEYSAFDQDFCMSKEDTLKYRADILELKERYKGKMDIYLGIERDYFGEGDEYPYDFVIGSVHYAPAPDGTPLSVDNTEEIMAADVQKYFGGDFRAYVESYYMTAAKVMEKTKADIVGHFDLVTKFNEGNRYFDEEAPWYREAAIYALRSAAKGKPIFEINTGAMARGYRRTPYPAGFLIEEIERLGCPIILSSDCHDKAYLDHGFGQLIQ